VSSARRWPEGVPELPRPTRHYELLGERWHPCGPYLHTPGQFPRVAVLDGCVIDANTAARALGIVPYREQEPSVG
jgi:hypothetical protein